MREWEGEREKRRKREGGMDKERKGKDVELNHLGSVPQSLSQSPWEVDRVRIAQVSQLVLCSIGISEGYGGRQELHTPHTSLYVLTVQICAGKSWSSSREVDIAKSATVWREVCSGVHGHRRKYGPASEEFRSSC